MESVKPSILTQEIYLLTDGDGKVLQLDGGADMVFTDYTLCCSVADAVEETDGFTPTILTLSMPVAVAFQKSPRKNDLN